MVRLPLRERLPLCNARANTDARECWVRRQCRTADLASVSANPGRAAAELAMADLATSHLDAISGRGRGAVGGARLAMAPRDG